METPKPVSRKEKQKDKPKIGAGTKDEKRRQKKEKLVKELQMKKEAQQPAPQPEVIPATFGKDFDIGLQRIALSANTGDVLTEKGKRQKTTEIVSQWKQINASTNFNSSRVYSDVNKQLTQKTKMLIQHERNEEERRLKLEQLDQMEKETQ